MVGVGDNDNSDDELFLADCRVESLSNVYLNLPKLRSLNLHANYIPRWIVFLYVLSSDGATKNFIKFI